VQEDHIPHRKMAVELDASAMEELQVEQRALLDKVAELGGLGLGKLVDHPQLVVVGDRSAGKSSVLEAISRVPFPIGGESPAFLTSAPAGGASTDVRH